MMDILSYDKSVYRFMKYSTLDHYIGYVLALVFLVWLFIEIDIEAFLLPIIIGVAIGVVIGQSLFMSIIRDARELRRDISIMEKYK